MPSSVDEIMAPIPPFLDGSIVWIDIAAIKSRRDAFTAFVDSMAVSIFLLAARFGRWRPFCVIFASFLRHFRVRFETFLSPFRVRFESFLGQFCVSFESVLRHF